MNVVKVITYLNSADGPNIPLRTLAAYLGSSSASLSTYIRGKVVPSADVAAKMEKGIKELAQEIAAEAGAIKIVWKPDS